MPRQVDIFCKAFFKNMPSKRYIGDVKFLRNLLVGFEKRTSQELP